MKLHDKIKSFTAEEKSAFLLGGVFVYADQAKEEGLFPDLSIEEVMIGILSQANEKEKEIIGDIEL